MTRKTAALSTLGACLTVTVLAALAACSSGESSSARASTVTGAVTTSGVVEPTTTASTSTTTDPTERAVLTAYRGYWAARVKAQAAPNQPPPAELDTFAIDTARTDLNASILLFRQRGIAFRGQPVLSPVVTVTRTGPDGAASVVDCVDSTHWTPVFTATGNSALAPGQLMRIVVESAARVYVGRWVVESSVAHRDRPC